MLPQLGREPVGGVNARNRAKHGPQRRVVTDQRDGTSPGRQRMQALDQRKPDHGTDRVTGTPGPAGFLKVRDQRGDLRAVQQRSDTCGVARQ